MQKLISKYGLAAHLAILAVAPLFLFPFFAPAQIATAELWLCAVAVIWTLMEPSRRNDEMLHDARTRVASSIVRDPLFWIMLTLVVLALVRWANGGIALKCDFNGGSPFWYLRDPGWKYLPGSVSGTGYPAFVAALVALALTQGCGHGLGKTARIYFLFAAAVLAGVAALTAIVLCEFGNSEALRVVWCGNMTAASFVGTAFGMHLVGGIAALVGTFECRWNRQMLLLLFAIGGNAAGLFFFAPTFVVLVFLTAALVSLLASLAYAAVKMGVTPMAKCVAVLFMTLLIPVLIVMGVAFFGEKEHNGIAALVRTAKMTRNAETVPVERAELAQCAMYLASMDRMAFASDGALFPGHFTTRRATLSGVARRIWGEHPWLGSGLGSYHLALRFSATPEDWQVLNPGKDEHSLPERLKAGFEDAGDREKPEGFVTMPTEWGSIGAERAGVPFCGWWLLLAERGLIGAVCLAVALGCLLFNFTRRLIGALGRSMFVPSCVTGVVVLLALVVETFVDASFLRPEVLATAAAFLAVSASSFPAPRKPAGPTDGEKTQENK